LLLAISRWLFIAHNFEKRKKIVVQKVALEALVLLAICGKTTKNQNLSSFVFCLSSFFTIFAHKRKIEQKL
jgi:hypothetical protein